MLRPKCNLVNSDGGVAEEEIDQKVEFYFNLMLESLEEFKNESNGEDLKLSLQG